MDTQKRERVLIVEDDELQSLAYAEILGTAFDVEVVHLFSHAQARLASDPPIEGIVFDLHLPNGHGIGLVRQLQSTVPRVPMVVVTGHEIQAVEVISAGAQDFLRKPVEPQVLLESVAKALARHAVRGEFHEERHLVQEIKKDAEKLSAQRADLLASVPPGSPKPPSGPPLRGKA